MLSAIAAFFAFGALGFWLLTIVASIIFITGVESDSYTLSGIITVIFGCVYWKSIVALGLGWQAVAIGIAAYVILGIGWSVWRWWRFVHKTIEKYTQKGKALTETAKSDIKEDVSVSKNKGRIIGWIAYWPWSAFWNLTGDFFTTIFDGMRAAYQRISDNILKSAGIN